MTEQGGQQDNQKGGHFWPDETVDAIAAFVVISALTLMALWFVIG